MDRDLRRLVLLGVALLLVLFVGRAIIGSLYDEAGARRQIARLNGRLRAGGEAESKPDRGEMTRMAALRDELTDRLDTAVAAVNYTLPPEFDVGPGQSPDLRYIEVVRREHADELTQAARQEVPGEPDVLFEGVRLVLR